MKKDLFNSIKIAAQLKESDIGHFRKENSFYKGIAVVIPSLTNKLSERIAAPIVARFYKTASREYCVLWINATKSPTHNMQSVSSGGMAAGAGYHKPSAALEKAIAKAGITIAEISGDFAMENALLAIAKKLYPNRKAFIHVSHA